MVETLKRKQLSTGMGILAVLLIVALTLFLVFTISFIQFVLNINWPQFIAYAIVIVAGVCIVKYYLTEYIYQIEKGRIIFYRKLGSREKELLAIPLRDMEKCGEYADIIKKDDKKRKVYKFTFLKKSSTFALDFKLFVVLINVSEEFKNKLKGKK